MLARKLVCSCVHGNKDITDLNVCNPVNVCYRCPVPTLSPCLVQFSKLMCLFKHVNYPEQMEYGLCRGFVSFLGHWIPSLPSTLLLKCRNSHLHIQRSEGALNWICLWSLAQVWEYCANKMPSWRNWGGGDVGELGRFVEPLHGQMGPIQDWGAQGFSLTLRQLAGALFILRWKAPFLGDIVVSGHALLLCRWAVGWQLPNTLWLYWNEGRRSMHV